MIEQLGVDLLDLHRRQRLQFVAPEVLLQPADGNVVGVVGGRAQARLLACQPFVEEVAQAQVRTGHHSAVDDRLLDLGESELGLAFRPEPLLHLLATLAGLRVEPSVDLVRPTAAALEDGPPCHGGMLDRDVIIL